MLQLMMLLLLQLQHAAGRVPSCRYISHLLRIETFCKFNNLIRDAGSGGRQWSCHLQNEVVGEIYVAHSTFKLNWDPPPPPCLFAMLCYLQLRSTCAPEFCYFASVRLPDLGSSLHPCIPLLLPSSQYPWSVAGIWTSVERMYEHTLIHTHTHARLVHTS